MNINIPEKPARLLVNIMSVHKMQSIICSSNHLKIYDLNKCAM